MRVFKRLWIGLAVLCALGPAAASACERALLVAGTLPVFSPLSKEAIALIQQEFSELGLDRAQIYHLDERMGAPVSVRRSRHRTAHALRTMRKDSAWLTSLFHALHSWDTERKKWVRQPRVEAYLGKFIYEEWESSGMTKPVAERIAHRLLKARKPMDTESDVIESVIRDYDRDTIYKHRSRLAIYARLRKMFRENASFQRSIFWHLHNRWKVSVVEWQGWSSNITIADLEGLPTHEMSREQQRTYGVADTLLHFFPQVPRGSLHEKAIIELLEGLHKNPKIRGGGRSSEEMAAAVDSMLHNWVRRTRENSKLSSPLYELERHGLKRFDDAIQGLMPQGLLRYLVSPHAKDSNFGLNALRWICNQLGLELFWIGDEAVARALKFPNQRKRSDAVAVDATDRQNPVFHVFEFKESRGGPSGRRDPARATNADIPCAIEQLESVVGGLRELRLPVGGAHLMLLPESMIAVNSGYNIHLVPELREFRLYQGDDEVMVGGDLPVRIHFVDSK